MQHSPLTSSAARFSGLVVLSIPEFPEPPNPSRIPREVLDPMLARSQLLKPLCSTRLSSHLVGIKHTDLPAAQELETKDLGFPSQ